MRFPTWPNLMIQLAIVFGMTVSLQSQTIYVTNFSNLESGQSDKELSTKIQDTILGYLESRGLSAKKLDATLDSLGVEQSDFLDNDLLLGGYYERTASGQLNLYAQIYKAKNTKIIDAVNKLNLYDQVSTLSQYKINAEELKSTDEKALEQFAALIVTSLSTNPNQNPRPDKIEENILSSKIQDRVAQHLIKDHRDIAERETFELFEEQEFVTATKTKIAIKDAPAAVYVLNAKEIRERGYRTLVDALADIPGFDIIHTYGVFPDLIHQRGLVGNNQRSLLYINGVPDNNITENALLGGSIRFPLHNVKRIEVVSGPASALYGANAFNGVINIILKDGKDQNLTQTEMMHGYYESGFKNPGSAVNLSTNGHVGEKEDMISWNVQAYYYKTEGPNFGGIQNLQKKGDHSNDALYRLETELCGQQCNPDEKSVGYYWSDLYNVSWEDTYNINAGFRSGNFRFQTVNWQYLQGEGTFSNATNTVDTDYQDYEGNAWDFRNNSVMLGYLYPIGDKLELDTEIIARHSEVLSSSKEETLNSPGPDYQYKPRDTIVYDSYARPDYLYEIKERLQWNPTRDLNTTLGGEASYSVVPQGYNHRNRYIYKNYAAYLQQYWKLFSMLALTGGYRYDSNTNYGLSHTPRIGAVITPGDDLTIKLLYSTGFRGPTAWESFNETKQRRANKKLTPERMRTMEGGIAWRISRNYYISVQQYYTKIRDLLLEIQTNEPNPDVPGSNYSQNQNVGKAKIYGTEVSSDIQLSNTWHIFANYTYNKGEYYDLPSEVTSSPSTRGRTGDDYMLDYLNEQNDLSLVPSEGPIPNIASHHFNLGVTWYLRPDLSWHIRGNYVDLRRTIADNPEKTVEGYTLWHTNLRWENAFLDGMFLQLLVRNLGNERFFDPGIRTATGAYYPSRHPIEGRNFWVSLGYKF